MDRYRTFPVFLANSSSNQRVRKAESSADYITNKRSHLEWQMAVHSGVKSCVFKIS